MPVLYYLQGFVSSFHCIWYCSLCCKFLFQVYVICSHSHE